MARGFDTIVVGAGSAGAVIASRMTERDSNEVLLLEAGPDYADIAKLPRDLVDATRNSQTRHDWGYSHQASPTGKRLPMPRGRVVGGSSAVNTCIALRGAREDYDEWAALGLPDWKWEHCLPAFKRLEDDRDFDDPWHGRGGPIPIRRHTREELVPWQAGFMDACTEAGLPSCADTNNPTLTGFGPHAMNKLDNVRQSAARCYLTPDVRARKNLHLEANTLVHRAILDGRRVVGVEVEQRGKREIVSCKRLVLSAGAVSTPGVLLRSGIGPRAELERLGVAQQVELPAVGARLLDHAGTAVFFRPKWGVMHFADPLVQTVFRFTSRNSKIPNDMQIQPGSHVPLPWFSLPMVTLAVCVGKPFGHGRLRFHSLDPRAKVGMEMHFFVKPEDRAFALEALELIRDLASRGPLRKLGQLLWPTAKVLKSREALDGWLQRWCGSGFHPSGTVPMGADDSPDAACDGRGRVRGVEGLVVADASIMPTIPSANTNLATLMIGERFGEWLRDGAI